MLIWYTGGVAPIFEPYDLVIFDLDGTLIDSRHDIAEAVNKSLVKWGFPSRSVEEIGSLLFQGGRSLISTLLPDERLTMRKNVFQSYIDFYQDNLLGRTRFYPGAIELLEKLSPKTLAVMSNKREALCRDILKGLGRADHFSHILGGDSLPQKKPSPLPLRWISDALEIEPSRAIMVGDSPVDIQSAQAAGMRSIGLTGGFCSAASVRQAQPSYVFDHLTDLL